MKTNLFNTNYSAPEMKVIELELEGVLCESKTGGVNAMGLTDFGTSNSTDESSDWK